MTDLKSFCETLLTEFIQRNIKFSFSKSKKRQTLKGEKMHQKVNYKLQVGLIDNEYTQKMNLQLKDLHIKHLIAIANHFLLLGPYKYNTQKSCVLFFFVQNGY
jgi:uncharacterized protein YajQ (UPF0234 family)